MGFLMPVLLLFIFGYAISLEWMTSRRSSTIRTGAA